MPAARIDTPPSRGRSECEWHGLLAIVIAAAAFALLLGLLEGVDRV
jgi:hypothetical protein